MLDVYKALYRKYRPQSFEDVISQPHITSTLKNQIVSGKTAHAYIFTGSRGTGKTTCARIMAKALICESPKNGEPCLECENCRDLEAGRLADVIEIDAASYGGVDDARELREEAFYAPERCRYRIYIIDEVHMLSKEAFNALLKLIEEPPPHVKFILATTEIHKVLPTILSRCQRFDFRRIRYEDIAARLLHVAEAEKITLAPDAAELIAKAADGGMRDALSILDRCAAYSEDITAESAAEAAGIAGRESVTALAEALCEKDAGAALKMISELYSNSKDMSRLCAELIEQFRNIMILKNIPGGEALITAMPDEIARLRAAAEKCTHEHIMDTAAALADCSKKMGVCMSPRIELEMTAAAVCTGTAVRKDASSAAPAVNDETAALKLRISELERQLRDIAAGGISPAREVRSSRPAERLPLDRVTDAPPMNDSARPITQWAEILEKFAAVCPPVSGALKGSQAYELGNYLLIVTDNNFFLQLLRNKENASKLVETVFSVTGKRYTVRAKCTAPQNSPAENRLIPLLEKAAAENIPVDTV